MPEARGTTYGRDALKELATAIAELKGDDLLAPVQVIVASHGLSVRVRRDLAEFHGGFASVNFQTLAGFASQIAASGLRASGRQPLSRTMLTASIRQALIASPGIFAEVVEHPATEQVLAATYDDLAVVDESQLDLLAEQNRRCHDAIEICTKARRSLEKNFYDHEDIYRAATKAIGARSPGGEPLIVYLPQELSKPAKDLLKALATANPKMIVIAAFTGDKAADHEVTSLLDALELKATSPTNKPATANAIVSTSDSDDEVANAIRLALSALDEGAAPHRVGIVYGSKRPYARLVAEQLENTGVAFHGAEASSLGETMAGRLLTSLLELQDHDLRRDDVIGLLRSAPLRDSQRRSLPVASWDRISRAAGVVSGSDWGTRLEHHAAVLASRIKDRVTQDETTRHLEIELGNCSRLSDFVEDVRSKVSMPPNTSWSERAGLYADLLDTFLNQDEPNEQDLSGRYAVKALLSQLKALDEIEPEVSAAVFRRTVQVELSAGHRKSGRLGQGIFVGPVKNATGVILDHLIIVGMAEGMFPTRNSDTSLIGDQQRKLLGGVLPLSKHRTDRQHHDFLAALGCTTHKRTLFFPRGDIRSSKPRIPSRWLLKTASALAGKTLYSKDLESSEYEWLSCVPSYSAGLTSTRLPASEQEFRLNQLANETTLPKPLRDTVGDDEILDRARTLIRARASHEFTRFDGNLSGEPLPAVGVDRPVSPTQLETWVNCPFGYFVKRLLRVEPLESPEELLQMSALDKGSLVHEIAERFINDALESGSLPAPHERWPVQARYELVEILDELAQEFEAQGRVGRPLLWKMTRTRIKRELENFILLDDATRAELDLSPISTEASFGFDEIAPVRRTLPGGSTVRFRGSADRIDRANSGAVLITDYKTGSSFSFKDIDSDNAVVSGKKLQLPIYALAAQMLLSAEDSPVRAEYRFLTEGKRIGYGVDAEVLAQFDSAVTTILAGISQGLFPQHPEDAFAYTPCLYCDPDEQGNGAVHRRWDHKKYEPVLDAYRELVEPSE